MAHNEWEPYSLPLHLFLTMSLIQAMAKNFIGTISSKCSALRILGWDFLRIKSRSQIR